MQILAETQILYLMSTGIIYITIQFGSGKPYTYSYESAGKANIETMKQLADSGRGLNSFVMRNVKKLYVK